MAHSSSGRRACFSSYSWESLEERHRHPTTRPLLCAAGTLPLLVALARGVRAVPPLAPAVTTLTFEIRCVPHPSLSHSLFFCGLQAPICCTWSWSLTQSTNRPVLSVAWSNPASCRAVAVCAGPTTRLTPHHTVHERLHGETGISSEDACVRACVRAGAHTVVFVRCGQYAGRDGTHAQQLEYATILGVCVGSSPKPCHAFSAQLETHERCDRGRTTRWSLKDRKARALGAQPIAEQAWHVILLKRGCGMLLRDRQASASIRK